MLVSHHFATFVDGSSLEIFLSSRRDTVYMSFTWKCAPQNNSNASVKTNVGFFRSRCLLGLKYPGTSTKKFGREGDFNKTKINLTLHIATFKTCA